MNHADLRTVDKVRQRLDLLAAARHRERRPIDPLLLRRLDGPEFDPPLDDPPGSADIPVAPGTPWGEPCLDFILRGTVTVPADWRGRGPVALSLPLGVAGDFSHPEALVYLDGQPLGSSDRHHREVRLGERWCDGESHDLALHGWTGGTIAGSGATIVQKAPLMMGEVGLVLIDEACTELHTVLRIALGVAEQLATDDPVRRGLLRTLEDAVGALDTREPLGDALRESVAAALEIARNGIATLGPPSLSVVHAVGHAHIDVAWLWTLAQTRRKAGRTFHNAVALMDEFPDFHFTQSQPQLYEYVRCDYPELFESIRKRVAEGRWEPIGGMWVEADCNISGGEALVRQLLLGRRFFREHFGAGADSPVLWLPDVFGYAWSLPQLVKAAGMEYFFTTKLSWNLYNRLPADSFWWRGIDGTAVLTHCSPTPSIADPVPWSTYNALAGPADVFGTWRNYRHDDVGKAGPPAPVLMAYGWGDGGGGPTHEMAENLVELAHFPAAPRTIQGRAGEFFRQLEDAVGDELPVWDGELYLEYHQGTFTTHGAVKRGNRRGEFALHDAELLAAWATIATGAPYPRDALNQAWRLLCLHQFHDILPGSSIGEVYLDTARDHAVVASTAEDVIERSLTALANTVAGPADFVAVNPTPFPSPAPVAVPIALAPGTTLAADGVPLCTQELDGATLVDLPALGGHALTALSVVDATAATLGDGDEVATVVEPGGRVVLENSLVRVELERSGEVRSFYDKRYSREVLVPGARGNVLQAMEDRPIEFDAWNIDAFIGDRTWEAEPAGDPVVLESGPLRAAVRCSRRIGTSTIVQTIRLAAGRTQLDVLSEVDWRERQTMLKVAFPVEIAARAATFEIQWGNVERPTHDNTSWERAQYEVCAHKWVDLSEADYGVSLLNDCKYGHNVKGNVLRLTLLRGTTSPDPHADIGEHRFTYSLLPHAGDWRGETVAAAYHLNDPVIVRTVGSPAAADHTSSPSATWLLAVDRRNVIVETVKIAEDGDGLIVRLFEHHRTRGSVTLTTSFPLARAERCNLLEESDPEATCVIEGNSVRFDITPYRIVTLRLVPA